METSALMLITVVPNLLLTRRAIQNYILRLRERKIIDGINESCKLENSEQHGYTSNLTMNAQKLSSKFNSYWDSSISLNYERFFEKRVFNPNYFDQNPGFKIKWFYTGDYAIPSVNVHNNGLNNEFRRYLNYLI